MIFYHFCPARLAPGSVIEAGNFGHLVSLYGYRHNYFGREASIERIRILNAPAAPSRLACVFAFLSQIDAAHFKFREQSSATSYLYEVEAAAADAPILAVRMDLLNRWDEQQADGISAAYWASGYRPGVDPAPVIDPSVPIRADFYEVLIGGPVKVLRRLPL